MRTHCHEPIETLTSQRGRTIAFARYGASDGRPLYFCHGFPGSRLQAALVHEQARDAGVAVIAIDRPGFGASSLVPRRRILDWPRDLVVVADYLGHERFGVLGVSCGGPYALACAHELAARIEYVGLLAGIGPTDVAALNRKQMRLLRVMFALARIHPLLISPLLWLDRALFRWNAARAVESLAAMMTPPDRRLLRANPQAHAQFAASLAEAYRQGIAGPLREAQLIARQGEFRLQDVTLPVHLYQGGCDRHVPVEMARHVVTQLAHGQLHLYPDEGHLSIVVNRFADCLRDFAARPTQRTIEGA